MRSFPPDTLRLLDAAANRACEGLRVLEDFARFTLDHHELTAECKALRHGVRRALLDSGIDPLLLIAGRDTPGDVGTAITTDTERTRTTRRAVVDSAAGRAAEALRSIEESLKLAAGAAGAAESIRYRLYDAHKRLSMAMGADREGFHGWRLCVLITESLCARYSWLETARLAIAGGADCVQLREKTLDDRRLLRRSRELVGLARPMGAGVIINDRADIALLAGADGVHLGQGDLDAGSVRKLAGSRLLVGVSASTVEHAVAAHLAGADYCGVGAMFPTGTKQKPSIAGPPLLRDYLAHTPALPPALAIGGINAGNTAELNAVSSGKPFGVAVSAAICAADDPEAAARSIRQQLIAPDTTDPELPCPSNSTRRPSATA